MPVKYHFQKFFSMTHNKIFLGSSIFLLGIFIMSSFLISFDDKLLNQANAVLLDSPIIHMSDTTQTSGRSTYSDRPIHAEYVSSTSQLVGDNIDSITLKLKKTKSPTGIATIGIFNEDLSVKKEFGTVDAAKLSKTYSEVTFTLPSGETYQIESGDFIGIKFTGGDRKNHVSTMIDADNSDPFDGANSYHVYYRHSWKSFQTNDLYMILKQNHSSASVPSDTTAPTTTASLPSGTYTNGQSVSLSANEPAVIYYTTNGSTPTTSSPVYASSIPVATSTTLKFFAVDNAGNKESTKTESYIIDSSGNDLFGIKQIYQTKTGGNTWFMDMTNPSSDPRFDPQNTITKNSDGSWKIQNNKVRMTVFATDKDTYKNTPIPTFSRNDLANTGYMQLPSDWKNFEMTGYVKLNVASSDEFTWYGRGGSHNDNNSGCEGSAYKGQLILDGGSRFAKESWHVNYDFTKKKYNTPSLLDKWVGFKFIVYNQPGINFDQMVHMEIWADLQNNNNWVMVDSFTDDGWGSGASHCGPAIADNMPMTWGGPEVTFRADNASDIDFKYLSVREITS